MSAPFSITGSLTLIVMHAICKEDVKVDGSYTQNLMCDTKDQSLNADSCHPEWQSGCITAEAKKESRWCYSDGVKVGGRF